MDTIPQHMTIEVLATPTNTTTTLHDYENLVWETETEPPAHLPICTLYHLYTITGLLSVGMWPHDAVIGEHYLAWAPLTPNISYTLH